MQRIAYIGLEDEQPADTGAAAKATTGVKEVSYEVRRGTKRARIEEDSGREDQGGEDIGEWMRLTLRRLRISGRFHTIVSLKVY